MFILFYFSSSPRKERSVVTNENPQIPWVIQWYHESLWPLSKLMVVKAFYSHKRTVCFCNILEMRLFYQDDWGKDRVKGWGFMAFSRKWKQIAEIQTEFISTEFVVK